MPAELICIRPDWLNTSVAAIQYAGGNKMTKQEKAPSSLTEAETDRVAGGDNNGHHWGQLKAEGEPAWTVDGFSGKGKALGHDLGPGG